MATDHLTTTRRTLLGAIATIPAIGFAAPAAAQTVTTGRTAWNRAFAAMEHAKAACAAEEALHQPVWEAYAAAKAAVPHTTLRPDPYSGRHEPVTTADFRLVEEARRLVNNVAAGKCRLETDRYPSLKAHYELCQDLVAADDERDAEIQRIDQQLGYSETYDRYEAAAEALCDAQQALHDLPSPDSAALLWKLEDTWLGDEEASYLKSRVSMILTDARRLLSGEA